MEEKLIIKTPTLIPELKLPTKSNSRPISATKSKAYLPPKPARPSTATNANKPASNTSTMDVKTPKGTTTFYEKLLRSQSKASMNTTPSVEYNNKTNPSVTMITISPTKPPSSIASSTSLQTDKIVVPDTLDDTQIRQLKKLALKKQIEDMRSKKKETK